MAGAGNCGQAAVRQDGRGDDKYFSLNFIDMYTLRFYDVDVLTIRLGGAHPMTTLVKLPAFSQFNQLHDEVNRFLDGAFRTANSAVTEWVPRADIYESEQGLVMQFDLPGLRREGLDIRIENDTLTIKGERKLASSPESYLRVERTHGAFTRVFALPDFVQQEKIEANLADGVLTVAMPRREETRPRQIQVQVKETAKA